MIDIVFPSGNEEEFIEMAKRLGIAGLVFVHKEKSRFYDKKTDIPVKNALLVEPAKIRNIRNAGIATICTASREAIEREADIVYGFELLEARDKTHYRASGLNQVLCTLATDKKVHIGLSVSEILTAVGQNRAILLGRMMQNIRLCTKYKTPVKIASFAKEPYQLRSPAELTSLFVQLGMHPRAARQALS